MCVRVCVRGMTRLCVQVDAQNKMQALELEKHALAKKLAAQVEATKNAEKDMRLMYTRHKKQMQVSTCILYFFRHNMYMSMIMWICLRVV